MTNDPTRNKKGSTGRDREDFFVGLGQKKKGLLKFELSVTEAVLCFEKEKKRTLLHGMTRTEFMFAWLISFLERVGEGIIHREEFLSLSPRIFPLFLQPFLFPNFLLPSHQYTHTCTRHADALDVISFTKKAVTRFFFLRSERARTHESKPMAIRVEFKCLVYKNQIGV